MAQFSLVEYLEGEKSYFAEWFTDLDAAPAARIDRYVRRMEFGNFGDSKSVGQGVRELRIDFGPGYRVYYGIDEGRIVLLLGGGTKRGQSRDIRNAIDRWTTYQERKRKR
jgi:putative addiction module killer protein